MKIFIGPDQRPENAYRRALVKAFVQDQLELACTLDEADGVVIIGDRKEALELARSVERDIATFHLGAGARTYGSRDDMYREEISEICDYHLCETSMEVARMSWSEGGAIRVGNLAADFLRDSNATVSSPPLPYFVLIYNPPTALSNSGVKQEISILSSVLSNYENNVMAFFPTEGEQYSNLICEELNRIPNLRWVSNELPEIFKSIVLNSAAFITNSSCGLTEFPCYKPHTTIINYGVRQLGREIPRGVVSVNADGLVLRKAIDEREVPVWGESQYDMPGGALVAAQFIRLMMEQNA